MKENSWTPRQRLLAILNGEQPDQVPWFGDLDYWATSLRVRGLVPEGFINSQGYIDWHRDLGVGFYLQGFIPFKPVYDKSVTVRRWQEGNNRYCQFDTPRGSLRECWEWLDESFSQSPTSHLLKDRSELPALIYLFSHVHYEPDYTPLQHRLQQVGEQGIVLGYLPKGPFMQLLTESCGIENLSILQADAPDELAELLAVMETAHNCAAQIALDSPAEALMIPENLSAEMVGPRNFEAFLRPYQTHWAQKIADAKKYSFVHMDGTLKGLLRQECSVGLTVLEALTPEPVGDVAVEEWADYAGDSRTILWGGLPGVYFTAHVSDSEFERHVQAVLAIMRREPRYVLGVADQVPPDALESRVRRVCELVDRFGMYETT